jgi:hypothetical protein
MEEEQCSHRRATYSLTRSDWSFACPDCLSAKKRVGCGASLEAAYEAFVGKCGAPSKRPTQ